MPDNDDMQHMTIDRRGLAELKKEYNKAVKEGKQVFVFREHNFVTGYAKYLIEYLDSKFNNKQQRRVTNE